MCYMNINFAQVSGIKLSQMVKLHYPGTTDLYRQSEINRYIFQKKFFTFGKSRTGEFSEYGELPNKHKW